MSDSFVSAALQPIRELPPPLGLFFRPGFNHIHDLAETLAGGHRAFHGAVFGASIKLKKRLEKNRQRLDRLRPAFGALAERASNLPFARVPRVRATREV